MGLAKESLTLLGPVKEEEESSVLDDAENSEMLLNEDSTELVRNAQTDIIDNKSEREEYFSARTHRVP